MRKKVLKIMGVFLIVIIGFSVLSRVIDSVNVAKIRGERSLLKTINHTIEQDVLVTHNREIPIFAESDLIVESIQVDVGQMIKEGDVLFTFSQDKLAEKQKDLKRDLEKMNLQMTAMKNQEQVNAKRYQQAVKSAKNELNRVKANSEQAVAQAQSDYSKAQKDYESYMMNEGTEEFDEAIASELKRAVETSKTAYAQMVRDKNNSIAIAKENLASTSIVDAKDTSMQQSLIDKAVLEEELAKVERLLAVSGQVKSTQSGNVTQINLMVGESSPMGAAMLMSDNKQGTKVELTVGEDSLKYLSQRNEVIVTGLGDDGELEERKDFKIASISPRTDMAKTYSVLIRMPEDAYVLGATVRVKVIAGETQYSNCVPVSAIYEEEQGKYYMYIVEMASTMFGETEVAKKVPVTVLDKNNEYAAIAEGYENEIITQTSRDLNDGDRVRRME